MSRGPVDYLLACCAHIDTEARLATDGIALSTRGVGEQLSIDRYTISIFGCRSLLQPKFCN